MDIFRDSEIAKLKGTAVIIPPATAPRLAPAPPRINSCREANCCGNQSIDFREKYLVVFGKISSNNDLTTTLLQIVPKVNFPHSRKSTVVLFFPPQVWTSFTFHCISLCLVYCAATPTVTKLPTITKASKHGLGSVFQPELILPRQISHFQFLETYLSSFPIRRRSNTDFSCAKHNAFWVRRLSSIITKYFKDVLALTAWDLCVSLTLKSLVAAQLSSPQMRGRSVRSPSPALPWEAVACSSRSGDGFWTTSQHVSPKNHDHLLLHCQTISCHPWRDTPAHPCCCQDKEIIVWEVNHEQRWHLYLVVFSFMHL